MPVEQVDLDALEKLHAAASPGTWTVEVEEYGNSGMISLPEINRILHDTEWADPKDFDQDNCNAEYITEAHNALPSLIAELRELRELVGCAMQFVFCRPGDGAQTWQTKQFLFVQRTRIRGEEIPETWEISQNGLHGPPMTLPEALAAARKWEAEHA